MQRVVFLMSSLLGVLLLAGCATTPPQTAEARQQAEEEIDTILNQPLNEEEYGKSVRCLPTLSYNSVEILDDQRLVFKGVGNRWWLNQLRNRCPGLRPRDTLRFDLTSSRLCEMDQVTAIDRFFYFWERTSATCMLGKFEPVTEDQVAAIKAALARAKESR